MTRMTRRIGSIVVRRTGLASHATTILATGLVLLAPVHPGEDAQDSAGAPPAAMVATREYRYVVSARVRPLLFWIRRENVGDARIASRTGTDDTQEYELLIGSDPHRAPFGINRWGYLYERVSSEGLTIVGVMTESDEDTVEQARARVSSAGGTTSRFKAMRARLHGGDAQAAVQRTVLSGTLTFHDLDAVLAWLPESGMSPRRVRLPDGVSRGFLSAVATLLDESVGVFQRTGQPASDRRLPFVHGTRLHELVRSSSAAGLFRVGAVTARTLESRFEVRGGGAVSRFRVTYGTEGRFDRVPLRVVYRPKWWFEAELVIETTGS